MAVFISIAWFGCIGWEFWYPRSIWLCNFVVDFNWIKGFTRYILSTINK